MSPSTAATKSATTAMKSSASANSPALWERLWRAGGIHFIVIFFVTYPDSVLAYKPTWLRLSETTHLVAIDLSGPDRQATEAGGER